MTSWRPDFLLRYIEQHLDVLDRVSKPGLFLNSVSEVDLAIRLHELGLLPEEYRQAFVTTVIAYAIEGEDLYALESLRIQSVFTSAELSAFRERVRAELVPRAIAAQISMRTSIWSGFLSRSPL
jgi:hypothetical protein